MTVQSRARLAASMSEDDLLRSCLDLAARLGVRTFHVRPGRTNHGWRTPVSGDGAGWPDLVLVGPGGVLYRELKSARGELRPDQQAWLDALRRAGQGAGVWRPDGWAAGIVQDQIRGVALR